VIKKYLITALCVVLFGGGIYLGYRVFRPSTPATQVTSQTVLITLKSEGFLVTQTFVLNQQVVIAKSSGSEWKDIFWGQTVTASGNIKVSSGVNLTKLRPEDVAVKGQKITVTLPPIEEQSVEVVGDIMLQNKQGILKKVFDNDTGYNQAYAKLKQEAQVAAQKEDLQSEAEENARKQITRLVQFISPEKQVTIVFKP
jgi:hypothetical protein